jgi:hypothetical protein
MLGKGRVEYLLKWKGYPSSRNTWEKAEVMSCPELVKKFEHSRKHKTTIKKVAFSKKMN